MHVFGFSLARYIRICGSSDFDSIELDDHKIMNDNPENNSNPSLESLEHRPPPPYTCSRCCFDICRFCKYIFGPNFTTNRRKTWMAIAFFIFSSYLMSIANIITEFQWTKTDQNDIGILPDVGFQFADRYTPYLVGLTNYVPITINSMLVLVIVWCLTFGPSTHKLLVFRRYLFIQSMLQFARSITIIVTQLPNPDPFAVNHRKSWKEGTDVFYEAVLVAFQIRATVTDVFFSGHSINYVMIALTVSQYSGCLWLSSIVWSISLFSLYMIIATNFHYTIDVLIGFLLTYALWKAYHLALQIPQLRENSKFFEWFEGVSNIAHVSDMHGSKIEKESIFYKVPFNDFCYNFCNKNDEEKEDIKLQQMENNNISKELYVCRVCNEKRMNLDENLMIDNIYSVSESGIICEINEEQAEIQYSASSSQDLTDTNGDDYGNHHQSKLLAVERVSFSEDKMHSSIDLP